MTSRSYSLRSSLSRSRRAIKILLILPRKNKPTILLPPFSLFYMLFTAKASMAFPWHWLAAKKTYLRLLVTGDNLIVSVIVVWHYPLVYHVHHTVVNRYLVTRTAHSHYNRYGKGLRRPLVKRPAYRKEIPQDTASPGKNSLSQSRTYYQSAFGFHGPRTAS